MKPLNDISNDIKARLDDGKTVTSTQRWQLKEHQMGFCNVCHEIKDLDEFTEDPESDFGFQYTCKDCGGSSSTAKTFEVPEGIKDEELIPWFQETRAEAKAQGAKAVPKNLSELYGKNGAYKDKVSYCPTCKRYNDGTKI